MFQNQPVLRLRDSSFLQNKHNKALLIQELDILPNFQVSQVIAKNEPIDVKCQQQKPIHNFFQRMNELGYETDNVVNQTVYFDDSHIDQTQDYCAVLSPNQSPSNPIDALNTISRFTPIKLMKSHVIERLKQLSIDIISLDYIRNEIFDYLQEFQDEIFVDMKNFAISCQNKLLVLIKNIKRNHQQQQDKFKRQIEEKEGNIRELKALNQKMAQQETNLSCQWEQLLQENEKIKSQITQIESQRSEMKSEIAKIFEYEQKIENFEQQIDDLSNQLENNSEYIFDLQQKVASNNLQLQEKENIIKKEFDTLLQQQRYRIEQTYVDQFAKIEEEIKEKAIRDLYQQYQTSIQNINSKHNIEIQRINKTHRLQLNIYEEIKQNYESDLSHFEEQKIKLINQNKHYQTKLHQLQQYQMLFKNMTRIDKQTVKIDEFCKTIQQLEEKCKNQDIQINYFKQLINNSSEFKNTNLPKKSNILVMDELDKSMYKAISPSSYVPYNQSICGSKEDIINTILSRIRMRQGESIISQLHNTSIQSINRGNLAKSKMRLVSPQSLILETQKDVRMKNISSKLQQLRADIRREITLIKH